MSYRILVVNPGSTSTKIGVYEDEQLLFDKTLRHSAEDIAQFNTIPAQKDWRRDLVMKALREQGLLIEQWGLDEIHADLERCGLAGSPTKVFRVQSIVLTKEGYTEVAPTEDGVRGLIHELVVDRTLG